MWANFKRDIARQGKPGLRGWLLAATKLNYHAILAFRISAKLATSKGPLARVLVLIVNFYSRALSSCYIHEHANIGGGLHLPHPTGIVIGEGVRIGEDVTIFQNVTLGSSKMSADSYPSVGDGVVIFANSVIVGPIAIGDGATIGAGSVVLRDVPPHSVAVGNPARILSSTNGETHVTA